MMETVESWAASYILTTSLSQKLSPPPIPDAWEKSPEVRRVEQPGRPPELRVVSKAKKTRGLAAPYGRARALHTFFHHELQAAELMAWAVLAFPGSPRSFREGLLRIAQDEIRHMNLYKGAIERLGHRIGDFAVRDWFWQRLSNVETPLEFVASMGLGFESANLEHSSAFAEKFRKAGDEDGARIQEIVGREEVAHVRFAMKWFTAFAGKFDFATWRSFLREPLSPMLMRGACLEREARRRAGFDDEFLDQLEAWTPELRVSWKSAPPGF